MPSYYPYLISSLPILQFGMRPPFSFDAFVERCRQLVPDEDVELLKSARGLPPSGNSTLSQWHTFNASLKNEIVKVRAERRRIDPSKYLREDGYPWPHFAHMALAAYRNPSILESERYLDQEKWNFLDSLAAGHYFDRDFLIVYGLKLAVLEKWERVRTADKKALLDKALAGG
jgi:hypothetical protein